MSEEVQPYESRMVKFKQSWEAALPYIKALVPAHVSPERIFSIAVTARQRNPKLLECSDVSVLRGIIIGAQLGLDVSGVGGKAYLVPFFNKNTKQLEAQFMPGYRGLMELARRTGQIAAFYGRVVYEGDEFSYQDGLVQTLVHVPRVGSQDPGQAVGCWVVAVWANGFRQVQVLSKVQLDRIRAASKAQDGDAWTIWWEEMALKSCLKRLCKVLPDSVELNRAIAMAEVAETGEPFIDVELPEAKVEPNLPAPTRTEEVKAEIKRGRGRPPKIKPADVAYMAPEELRRRGVAPPADDSRLDDDAAEPDEEPHDDDTSSDEDTP